MFKLIKLETAGFTLCTISLLIAYIYFDITKELAACTLCILDRFILFGIAALFAISYITKRKLFFRTLCTLNVTLCVLGIASTVRHIWLQKFQNKDTVDGFGCGGDFFYYISTLPILDAITNIFNNPTPCNDIKWQLFGLSIPMYTFILFIILTIINFNIIKEGKYDQI